MLCVVFFPVFVFLRCTNYGEFRRKWVERKWRFVFISNFDSGVRMEWLVCPPPPWPPGRHAGVDPEKNCKC